MDENEIADQLQEIGLTKYQSLAYIAAVSLGTATPNELSDASNVPQARIYDVIDELREMALVEVQERSRSKEIQAPPPEAMLERFKERHIESFSNRIHTIASSLDQMHEHERSSGGFVTMVRLQESALRHIRQAIKDAEWWLTMALPVDLYEKVTEEVQGAVTRGVSVRLVVNGNDARDVDPRPGVMGPDFPDDMAVRHRPSIDTYAFADRSYGIFNSKHPQEEVQPYIITQEHNLVLLFQHYAEQIWTGSEVIEPDGGLPRRYPDPWRLIVDLKQQLDTQAPLIAEVEGRETHTRRSGRWTGRIVDYGISGPVTANFSSVVPTTAQVSIETDDGTLSVGGWKATIEDIAADGIRVRHA
jgi:sugar-specific transcriptional regulator TrmB